MFIRAICNNSNQQKQLQEFKEIESMLKGLNANNEIQWALCNLYLSDLYLEQKDIEKSKHHLLQCIKLLVTKCKDQFTINSKEDGL